MLEVGTDGSMQAARSPRRFCCYRAGWIVTQRVGPSPGGLPNAHSAARAGQEYRWATAASTWPWGVVAKGILWTSVREPRLMDS